MIFFSKIIIIIIKIIVIQLGIVHAYAYNIYGKYQFFFNEVVQHYRDDFLVVKCVDAVVNNVNQTK
jgi:hypothetical protein